MSHAMFFLLYAIGGIIAMSAICYFVRRYHGFSILDVLCVIVLGPFLGLPFAAVFLLIICATTDTLTKERWFIHR